MPRTTCLPEATSIKITADIEAQSCTSNRLIQSSVPIEQTIRGPTMGREAFLSLLLVTTSMAYSSTNVAAARTKSRDAAAIADFARHLSNPPPSWVHGGDVCSGTFVGITCDGYARVTGINLTDKGLSGTLTSLLSTLTELKVLELAGNSLNGAIPSLAGMASLTHVVLSGNGFTAMPFDFFTGLPSLMFLEMDNLPLDPWLIPEAIGNCTQLQIFSASNVSIIGSLPAALANLKSITMLWLSYNYLRGSLPPWLAQLSSLEILGLDNQMSDVRLSGKIDVFASFTNIRELWIQSNYFSGLIPNFNNSRLESLNVSDNMLTGFVPTSLMGLESLQDVGLSNNFLQGPWPVFKAGVMVYMGYGNKFCQSDPGPCHQQVSILLYVAGGFGFPLELAQTWAGNDPCIGNWIGIVCRNGSVVEINLSGKNLSGFMSPAFANLSMLERLDLSKNQLKGVIPVALTTLRNLRILNVSSNNLSGQIPRFKSSVQVFAEGNHLSFRNSLSKAQMIGIIIGSILLVVILVLLAGLCMCYLKKKNDASEPASPTHLSTQQVITGTTHSPRHSVSTESTDSGCHSMSLVDKLKMHVLMKATNNFDESSVIGRGGTAVVFKGTLNGQDVAIKRFNSSTMGAEQVKGFNLEIEVLGKLNHRNVVKLLGYCVHNTERLLVYEYMSSGTLREHLQPSDRHAPLTWMQRVKISLDVAQGIEYLHGLSHEKLIHRDLKPSNILLDKNLTAKISDFGLVRLSEDKSSTSKTVGTYGYLAPEYASYGTLGSEIDVYSYGVILMEIITGRKAIDDSSSQDDVFLVPIFRTLVRDDKEKLRDIVDPTLELNGEDWNNLKEVADFAYYCTADDPERRPKMRFCVLMLSDIVDKYQPIVIGSDQGETSGMGMGLNERMQDWVKDIPATSGSDN